MERVTGIGGVFFRAKEPTALHEWYATHLGMPIGDHGTLFTAEAGAVTVWSTFPADTTYFGPGGQQLMVNYRVSDLDAMLTQLREAGVEIVGEIEVMDGVGRFGWAVDPEGNRFELWEPAPGA